MENSHSLSHDERLPIGATSASAFSPQDIARCSSQEARSFLSLAEAAAHCVLPLSLLRAGQKMTLHCASAEDTPASRARLRFLCGIEVSLTVVSREALAEGIERAYLGSDERLASGLCEISQRRRQEPLGRAEAAPPEGRGDAAKFLSALLEFGAVRGASDLHLCPVKEGAIVKIRLDGELMSQEAQPYPASLHEQVIARLKALAGLDVTCKRLPQDGAFRFTVAGRERSARLSTLPAVCGESAVVRLMQARSAPRIAELGLHPVVLAALRGAMRRTQGVVLLTGPTGSGKTTTMYAALRELKDAGRNVVTVEDPVEVPVQGVVQVGVQEEQGLTYPKAIRSVLRHDPDVILIGEMRDQESARIALESAATGHLTFSSLHVGSALLAIERLNSLGVARERAVPAVSLVLTQRLVPILCSSCKRRDDIASRSLGCEAFAPAGCEDCQHTGFSGRAVVAEALDLRSREAKQAMLVSASETELLERLPRGAFTPWLTSLRALVCEGKISARQADEFLGKEG